ncbi:hypothetical protein MC7420_6384 [Coleofasciculus chthonoplastes PCC 7420]|uniref:Uncharacterized protein n=2 Tax=Coleofasciculaceae TaxID=1892251 RepID=B4VQB3_9CYAN|nr:hypothetical protein MC7420_6384 [Coleofasciculus chthonoplastes PCC 7420]
MALLASFNYFLVLFDLTYLPLRDFWLHGEVQLFSFDIGPVSFPGLPLEVPLPPITQWYDPIKGIEPYRDTDQYLEKVNELEAEIDATNLRTKLRSLQSPEVAQILEYLRQRSVEMIETNPFQLADKTGDLEKIKNKMREHIATEEDSAKESFRQFWSLENLTAREPEDELQFFNDEIRPLMAANYYRPIGETGDFVDYFGLVDFPFFALFLAEFLARTWLISRHRTGVSWLDAMLWRWYDIFLLIPLWRWLRIIPVTIRLDQAKLVDMSAIQKQARQGFVAEIAGDMTQVVVIQIINELQSSIRQGEIANFLQQREVRPYIDLNETDEVAALTKIMVQMTVEQVLPAIRTDVEDLLRHNVDKILNQSQAYQGLEKVPGVETIRNQLTERLVHQITQALYNGLDAAIADDPVGDQILQRLISHLGEAYGSQIQTQKTLDEIQYLLNAFLEEVKVNYVERLSQEDLEDILDQTRAIRQKRQV